MILNFRKILVLFGGTEVRKENMKAFEMLLGLERENFSFSVNYFLLMCTCVCLLICMCTTCIQTMWRPEDSVSCPGPGVTGGCASLFVGSGN